MPIKTRKSVRSASNKDLNGMLILKIQRHFKQLTNSGMIDYRYRFLVQTPFAGDTFPATR